MCFYEQMNEFIYVRAGPVIDIFFNTSSNLAFYND